MKKNLNCKQVKKKKSSKEEESSFHERSVVGGPPTTISGQFRATVTGGRPVRGWPRLGIPGARPGVRVGMGGPVFIPLWKTQTPAPHAPPLSVGRAGGRAGRQGGRGRRRKRRWPIIPAVALTQMILMCIIGGWEGLKTENPSRNLRWDYPAEVTGC